MSEVLKVVHLSNTDIRGGASRAGYGIKYAINTVNPQTLFLTQRKFSNDKNVISLSDSFFNKQLTNARMLLDLFPIRMFTYTNNGRFSFANIGKDVSDIDEIKNADVLHLHWINEGFLSFKSLRMLGKLNKPIVWTFHDMWAFTGGCHYSSGCRRFEDKCGICPYLKNPGENDFSRKIWLKKTQLYNNLNLNIVTPSRWLKETAIKSSLLKHKFIEVIPYAIDTELYKPLNKRECRKAFDLPEDKILMLFGTMSTGEVRKGYHILKSALTKLSTDHPELKDHIEIVVVGAADGNSATDLPFKTHFTGRLYNEEKLVKSYNAADFFVAPSIEDNYPNTVMESLACGIPVLAFNIGGMPDMIINEQNGKLIDEVSADKLTGGLKWMIDNSQNESLSINARNKILSDNMPADIGTKYLELYKKIVNN